MNRQEFQTLDVAGRLPTPKGVALKLLRLLKSETASAQEIARAIKSDPALAGRVIGAANTLAARGPRPVASALEALARVGTATTCRLALGFSVLTSNRTGRCADFDYHEFWLRSLLTGILLQALASRTRVMANEEAFTLGLLSDVGQLALATLHPEEYGSTVARAPDTDRKGRIAIERAAFATDHVELSEFLLGEWGFPEMLVEVVSTHGRDDDDLADPRRRAVAAHLRLAELLARTIVHPDRRGSYDLEVLELTTELELTAEHLRQIGEETTAAWPVWTRLLGFDLKDVGRNVELAIAEPVAVAPMPDSANDADASAAPADTAMRMLCVTPEIAVQRGFAELAHDPQLVVSFASDEESALRETLRLSPHVIVCHWQDGADDALGFCRMLRRTAIGAAAYILVLASATHDRAIVDALDAGADDLLPWPSPRDVIAARVRVGRRIVKLQEALSHDRDKLRRYAADQAVTTRRLREVARSDPLTGLPNRRHAMDQLDSEWQISRRSETPLACLMVDIDHFKSVNDRFGHAAGDAVLKAIGDALRDAARASDVVCRVGGEEFLVLCRGADREAAMQCGERLRTAVLARDIGIAREAVTVSVGVAVSTDPGVRDVRTLVESADQALYRAKRDGRNRVLGAA